MLVLTRYVDVDFHGKFFFFLGGMKMGFRILIVLFGLVVDLIQEVVRKGCEALEKCEQMISKLGLFSSNETKDDFSTTNLKYILVSFWILIFVTLDIITNFFLLIRFSF